DHFAKHGIQNPGLAPGFFFVLAGPRGPGPVRDLFTTLAPNNLAGFSARTFMPATARLPSTNTPASRSSVTTLTFVSAASIVPGKTGAEISLHKQLVEDFSCVSKLKAGMVEGERNGVVYGASGDLEEHFDILRPDFAGLPVLCFAHMQLIVCLRR